MRLQLRSWFSQITGNSSTRGTRFNNGDRPNADTFKALADSTIFKTEADDRARENDLGATLSDLNGHVVAATDVEAKNNAAKPEDRTLVVQPRQLPTTTTSGTMVITAPTEPSLEFAEGPILEDEIDAGEDTRNSFIISITSTFTSWLQSVTDFIVQTRATLTDHLTNAFPVLESRVAANEVAIASLAGGTIPAAAPVGAVMMWDLVTPPVGYLLLEGQEVDQAAYPELYLHYGTSYNLGTETSGFFRLPNRTGYAPRGYKEGGIINGVGDVLGENRGSDTVGLTANNLPYHKHDINNLTTTTNGDHTHTITINAGDGTTPRSYVKESNNNSPRAATDIASASTAGAHNHTVSGETEFNATTQQAVEITNPVFLVNFIVKALP